VQKAIDNTGRVFAGNENLYAYLSMYLESLPSSSGRNAALQYVMKIILLKN
jgi:hypothetical protein